MRARILTIQSELWKEALCRVPHDVYHLPEYVGLCASVESGEPFALLVEDGSNLFLQPLLRRCLPKCCGGEGWDATSPYGYPGPLVTGPPAFVHGALSACAEILKATGCVSVFVRLHPHLNQAFAESLCVGGVVRHGYTVVQDLSLTPEELWSQTRSGHRYEIKRARREGFEFVIDPDWSRCDDFVQLYESTMDRRNASKFYLFPRSYFEDLRSRLDGVAHMAIVQREGLVAAAAILTETSTIVQYHLSASDLAFAKFQPTKLLLDEARAWARKRGNAIFHFGGGVGAAEDSLFRFKAGFSTGRLPFFTWRWVVDSKRYHEACGACDRLPLEPVLDGFFPAYRAS